MIDALIKFIPAPYQLLAKGIAFLALVAAVCFAAMQAYSWAYNNGATAEKLLYKSQENSELKARAAEIDRLNEKLAADAMAHNLELNEISAKYQEEKANEKATYDRTIASLRAGTISLRDKYANSKPAACAGITPDAFPTVGGHNGETGTELSQPVAEFLIGLTSEADEVVKQLSACQAGWQKLYQACTQR